MGRFADKKTLMRWTKTLYKNLVSISSADQSNRR